MAHAMVLACLAGPANEDRAAALKEARDGFAAYVERFRTLHTKARCTTRDAFRPKDGLPRDKGTGAPVPGARPTVSTYVLEEDITSSGRRRVERTSVSVDDLGRERTTRWIFLERPDGGERLFPDSRQASRTAPGPIVFGFGDSLAHVGARFPDTAAMSAATIIRDSTVVGGERSTLAGHEVIRIRATPPDDAPVRKSKWMGSGRAVCWWVAPSLGYAPVAWSTETPAGDRWMEVNNGDFRPVPDADGGPDVQFPFRMEYGNAILYTTTLVESCEINRSFGPAEFIMPIHDGRPAGGEAGWSKRTADSAAEGRRSPDEGLGNDPDFACAPAAATPWRWWAVLGGLAVAGIGIVIRHRGK